MTVINNDDDYSTRGHNSNYDRLTMIVTVFTVRSMMMTMRATMGQEEDDDDDDNNNDKMTDTDGV